MFDSGDVVLLTSLPRKNPVTRISSTRHGIIYFYSERGIRVLKNHIVKEKLMTTVTYIIPAISYGHCTRTIKTELKELECVQSVKATVDAKKVEINYPAEGLTQL